MPLLTEEQTQLVKMEVDEIPVEQLFTDVPLVARLSFGVQEVKALILRQREQVNKLASNQEK